MDKSKFAARDIDSYLDCYAKWKLEYDEKMEYLPRPRPWWEKLPRPYPNPPESKTETQWRVWWYEVLQRRDSFKVWLGYLEKPPWWGVESPEVSRRLTEEMNQGLARLRQEQYDRLKNNRCTPWPLLRFQCDRAHQEFMDNCMWYKNQYCRCDSGVSCLQCWDIRPQWNFFFEK